MSGTTKSIAEMIDNKPSVDNQELFDQLWEITSQLKDRVFARFSLQMDPCSAEFQPYASPDGSAQGFLSTFAGPEIDWLVYSWIGTPRTSFTNMHLTISLGPHINVPNFGFALGTAPDIFMYMDYLPRTDLWLDTTYLDKYYEPVNERFLQLRRDNRFSPFISQNLAMRSYQTATSQCYMVQASDETIAIVRDTANEMMDRWLTWVDNAPAVPSVEQDELANRDEFVRKTVAVRDPANAIAVKLFGQEMSDRLVDTLWGGNRTLPRANLGN